MKYLAIFLIVVMLVTVGLVAYTFLNTGIKVASITLTSVRLTDDADALKTFEQARLAVENNAFLGAINLTAVPGGADDYIFFTYTLALQNNSPLTMNMVELRVLPTAADILQLPDSGERKLPAMQKSTFSVTILTPVQNASSSRQIEITYYIWGKKYRATTTY